ncbi:hypothetical protein Sango_3093000 [Sesamum angolense]|uniref:DUF4283 domain-containing protein n=1 Tax=Sesamum angolense TaxID=2727404 RepID=A0AAE1T8Z5_9LAMI|nr:hypothetical protein Sango_3093000 [Sesamum angolense]
MAFNIEDDKIAAAFHKSSRKTLNFIPPTAQHGEVIVRLSIDIIRAGSQRWNTTAVGYFLGKKPYFHHLNEFVHSIWPAVRDVKAMSNGFFFFQFETVAAMEEVIEGGPWLYLGPTIVLQKWEPDMVLRKLKHTEVPVWIKLRHLPVELWTTDGLSTVASGIGRPLYPDAITRACTRLDFARVDVEYEWLPPKCTGCSRWMNRHARKSPDRTGSRRNPPEPEIDRVSEDMPGYNRDKGKDIVLFNAFDLLRKTDDEADGSSRVLINAAPQRVLQTNVTRIQSSLLSRWRWFVDYAGPVTVGNEPWLVGGDFNAVLDLSEVSGASGDIRVAMNEFNDCIIQTGLLSLPMQVTRKLKALKPVFRQQRRCKGDLAMNVKLAAGFLEVAHNILQLDRHNSLLLLLEHCCRLVYLKASKLEQTARAIDLRYLRPGLGIFSDDEARAIIQPVTLMKLKLSFDIEEDKAPGPDGFSSGFFKAAWPVV